MSNLSKEVPISVLPFLVSLLLRQDEFLLELYTMQLIYLASVLPHPFYEEQACTQGKLVLLDADLDIVDYINSTTFIVHDVEHLLYGLGYLQEEEDLITSLNVNDSSWTSERNPSFDLREWEDMFVCKSSAFFLTHVDFIGLEFVVTCNLVGSKVSVDVTYL